MHILKSSARDYIECKFVASESPSLLECVSWLMLKGSFKMSCSIFTRTEQKKTSPMDTGFKKVLNRWFENVKAAPAWASPLLVWVPPFLESGIKVSLSVHKTGLVDDIVQHNYLTNLSISHYHIQLLEIYTLFQTTTDIFHTSINIAHPWHIPNSMWKYCPWYVPMCSWALTWHQLWLTKWEMYPHLPRTSWSGSLSARGWVLKSVVLCHMGHFVVTISSCCASLIMSLVCVATLPSKLIVCFAASVQLVSFSSCVCCRPCPEFCSYLTMSAVRPNPSCLFISCLISPWVALFVPLANWKFICFPFTLWGLVMLSSLDKKSSKIHWQIWIPLPVLSVRYL